MIGLPFQNDEQGVVSKWSVRVVIIKKIDLKYFEVVIFIFHNKLASASRVYVTTIFVALVIDMIKQI